MTTRSGQRRRSYAVIWRNGDGPVRPGKLVLGATSFHLETGAPSGRLTAQGIRYADLASVENAPTAERIHGRQTALVKRSQREPLAIAALDGPGSGHEIVERLAAAVPSSGAA